LHEETGLLGEPRVIAIKHYRVYDERTQELVEDKLFFFCMVKDPEGEVVPHNEGKYEWVEKKDLLNYVTNHFESIEQFKKDVALIDNFKGEIYFEEVIHKTTKF
jgi:8-oxo-dGTP pyrophosphatase MutT (NUDIX family)